MKLKVNNVYSDALYTSVESIFDTLNIQVNEKFGRLRMGAYRDGVKRKGDKIGMGI